MRRVTGFLLSTAAAALIGCATPAAGPPAAAAAPAAAPAPAVVAAKDTPAATPTDKIKIPFGYQRIVSSDGEERYCRNDLVTGSRTEHERVCLTAAQLKASQDNSQSFIDSVQQHGGASTKTGAGLGGG
jgi:hypothetical protein